MTFRDLEGSNIVGVMDLVENGGFKTLLVRKGTKLYRIWADDDEALDVSPSCSALTLSVGEIYEVLPAYNDDAAALYITVSSGVDEQGHPRKFIVQSLDNSGKGVTRVPDADPVVLRFGEMSWYVDQFGRY